MEPVTITLAALGLAIQIGKGINGVKDIMASRKGVQNMRRQMRFFFDTIDEVDSMIARLQDLIYPKLHKIIRDLAKYCRELGEKITGFYYRFQNEFRVRLVNWMAMPLGWNQVARYQGRLEDCEDWLNVALMTSSLCASDEAKRRSARNLPEHLSEEDVLQGQAEARCRKKLLRHLNRVRRRNMRKRCKKMKRAGIDLSGLERLAENLVDEPVTETTRSVTSSPQPQTNTDYQYQPPPSPQGRSWTPEGSFHDRPVLSRQNERRRLSCTRQNTKVVPTPEHQSRPRTYHSIGSNPPLPRNNDHYREARYQIPARSRSPSAYHNSGVVVGSLAPPTPSMTANRQVFTASAQEPSENSLRGQRSSNGSSSITHVSSTTQRPSRTDTPHVMVDTGSHVSSDSGQRRRGSRQRTTSRSSSTHRDSRVLQESSGLPFAHVIEDSRPPLTLAPSHEQRERRQSSSSRSSSLSRDSGFVNGSPRLPRQELAESGPPITYERYQEASVRHLRRSTRAPSTSYDSEVADSPELRRSHVIRHSRPPIANGSDHRRSGRHRRRSRSRSSSLGYDSGIEMRGSFATNSATGH